MRSMDAYDRSFTSFKMTSKKEKMSPKKQRAEEERWEALKKIREQNSLALKYEFLDQRKNPT